jgi:P pilus assembly chaperone PapD
MLHLSRQDAHPTVHTGRARGTVPALVAFMGLALALVTALPRAARAQMTVDQLELVLAPAGALRHSGVFTVANEGAKPLQASLSVADWDRDDDGTNRFFPSGTLPQSCASRIKVFPLTLRLDPGASQAVQVSMEGSDSLSATCWAIVFVESVQGQSQATRGPQLLYVLRTGIKVYVEPSGLEREGGIEDLQVRPRTPAPAGAAARRDTSRAKSEVAIVFRNTGGLPLLTRGAVEIRRQDNSLVAKVDVPEFPTLPGAARRLAVPLPALPPGQYVLLSLLDYGGAELAAGRLDFEAR